MLSIRSHYARIRPLDSTASEFHENEHSAADGDDYGCNRGQEYRDECDDTKRVTRG